MTFSVKQFAEHYRVGQHTVLAWIRSGELQAVNVGRAIGGKPHWRIPSESVQAFELIRSAQPSAPKPRRRKKQSADCVKFY